MGDVSIGDNDVSQDIHYLFLAYKENDQNAVCVDDVLLALRVPV